MENLGSRGGYFEVVHTHHYYRQSTTLVVTCRLSCYAIREYTLRVDRDLVDVLLVREGEKVSLCI